MTTRATRRENGQLNVANLSINVIQNVEQIENCLEVFFSYHANFLWDKAKDHIERSRDSFRNTHQSNPSSILVSLMNALSQLTLADKNYLSLQFFSAKVFQRKDSVRCSYENLKLEFQRLEERGTLVGQKSNSLPQTPHHQNYCHQSPSLTMSAACQTSEPAQDVLNCNVEELFNEDKPKATPLAIAYESGTPTQKSQSFLSKIFRFSKSSSTSQSPPVSINSTNDSIHSFNSNCDDLSPELVRPETNTSLESLDRFSAHLSGQLIHYVRVRIEMIDLYDKLSCVCPGRKFCMVDECLKLLETIHINADRNFHHPVLSRLKTMFMFECDILLSLLQVHICIQNWKFLDTLFLLQDAHNKLNMMANIRDNMINQLNNVNYTPNSAMTKQQLGNIFSPLIPSSAAANSALRRNFTNSSLSSSGSSNLSVPPPNGANGNNHSPNPSSQLSFNYANQYQSSAYQTSSKVFQRSFSSSNMPLLIQWLNRYKLFLLSKYTFYFHSLLMVHLTPSSIASSFTNSMSSSSNHSSTANYAQMESLMLKLCTKHLYDFHSKIMQYLRKGDSTYVILIFDTHDKDEFSLSGYRSPYFKKEQLQGINSLPIIYSYPGEFPKNRIPSLIMIMNRRIEELNSSDSIVVEQDKPPDGLPPSSQSSSSAPTAASVSSLTASHNHQSYNQLPNATYYLVKPDPDFTLAMICEQKKLEKDVQIANFLQDLTGMLKGTKVFASLRNGSLKT